MNSNYNILIIGDVMLDINYDSKIERSAPEANISIYDVINTTYNLGGASNVCKNLSSLDMNVTILSVIGNDETGKQIIKLLEELNIIHDFIIDTDRKTTQKYRHFVNDKIVSRHDIENKENIKEDIETKLFDKFIYQVNNKEFQGIIFSDYAKGVLTPLLCQNIINYANKHNIKTFIDPKPKDFYKYKNCFLFKPNWLEAVTITEKNNSELSTIFLHPTSLNESNILSKLNSIISPNYILLTLGQNGMILYNENIYKKINHTKQINVVDVTGAGDIALSIFIYTFLKTNDVIYSFELSNYISGLSVQTKGNYVINKNEYDNYSLLFKKILNFKDIKHNLSFIQQISSKKIVFTNGCFDILHSAHVQLLKFCKSMGDIVIVGLNSDESIKRLKGNNRPINTIEERANILKQFDFIDLIIIFEEDTPYELIKYIKPYYLVKGGDYTIDNIIGSYYAKEIVLFEYVQGKSSTNVINKILMK